MVTSAPMGLPQGPRPGPSETPSKGCPAFMALAPAFVQLSLCGEGGEARFALQGGRSCMNLAICLSAGNLGWDSL